MRVGLESRQIREEVRALFRNDIVNEEMKNQLKFNDRNELLLDMIR